MSITQHDGKIRIESERLSTLCKVFREGETHHFAQYLVQSGDAGHAIIKGLESPAMSNRERTELNKRIIEVLQNDFGYKSGSFQRKKNGEFISVNLRMKK
jgi:hypothetical protein